MITGIYSKAFMPIKSSGVFKLKTNHIVICSFRLHDADTLTMNLGPCSDRHNNIDRIRHRNKSSLINRKGSDVATCGHLGNVPPPPPSSDGGIEKTREERRDRKNGKGTKKGDA